MPMKITATLAHIASRLIVKWGAQNSYGIVRHSTLWLRSEAVAQIAFLEWTGAETSASYCTSSWAG